MLEESSSADMVSGLRDGRLDVAFIRSGLVDPEGVVVHELLHEDMAAAFPARHPLAKRPRLTLKDLADETFILYRRPDGRGLYDVIIAACSEAGFSPHVGQEAPRIVSTLNLVAAGLGITIVPASLEPPAAGRCNLPAPARPARDQGAAQPRLPPRRALRRDARLHRPGAPPAVMIKTIGHSNHPIERFVDLLKAGGVKLLVDVRSMPYSRRFPQFGRERLAKSLGRGRHRLSSGKARRWAASRAKAAATTQLAARPAFKDALDRVIEPRRRTRRSA